MRKRDLSIDVLGLALPISWAGQLSIVLVIPLKDYSPSRYTRTMSFKRGIIYVSRCCVQVLYTEYLHRRILLEESRSVSNYTLSDRQARSRLYQGGGLSMLTAQRIERRALALIYDSKEDDADAATADNDDASHFAAKDPPLQVVWDWLPGEHRDYFVSLVCVTKCSFQDSLVEMVQYLELLLEGINSSIVCLSQVLLTMDHPLCCGCLHHQSTPSRG